eukprot:m.153901 g.153901  ORF g.153901 m.153901 type:complete len:72 (-) comp10180_c0_seq2:2079-2294(-)
MFIFGIQGTKTCHIFRTSALTGTDIHMAIQNAQQKRKASLEATKGENPFAVKDPVRGKVHAKLFKRYVATV